MARRGAPRVRADSVLLGSLGSDSIVVILLFVLLRQAKVPHDVVWYGQSLVSEPRPPHVDPLRRGPSRAPLGRWACFRPKRASVPSLASPSPLTFPSKVLPLKFLFLGLPF